MSRLTGIPSNGAPTVLQHNKQKGNFPYTTDEKANKSHTENGFLEDREFLDIFGIRLYYDDILLLSLIFFLYNEGVDDNGLFIALILLLLS